MTTATAMRKSGKRSAYAARRRRCLPRALVPRARRRAAPLARCRRRCVGASRRHERRTRAAHPPPPAARHRRPATQRARAPLPPGTARTYCAARMRRHAQTARPPRSRASRATPREAVAPPIRAKSRCRGRRRRTGRASHRRGHCCCCYYQCRNEAVVPPAAPRCPRRRRVAHSRATRCTTRARNSSEAACISPRHPCTCGRLRRCRRCCRHIYHQWRKRRSAACRAVARRRLVSIPAARQCARCYNTHTHTRARAAGARTYVQAGGRPAVPVAACPKRPRVECVAGRPGIRMDNGGRRSYRPLIAMRTTRSRPPARYREWVGMEMSGWQQQFGGKSESHTNRKFT